MFLTVKSLRGWGIHGHQNKIDRLVNKYEKMGYILMDVKPSNKNTLWYLHSIVIFMSPEQQQAQRAPQVQFMATYTDKDHRLALVELHHELTKGTPPQAVTKAWNNMIRTCNMEEYHI